MDSLADALHEVERALDEAVAQAYRSGELRRLDDAAVLTLMARAAGVVRRAEAMVVATVAEIHERVDASPHAERPTTRTGCRSLKELVQRTTLGSGRTVGEVVRAAKAVRQPVSLATGEVLAAEYPALRGRILSIDLHDRVFAAHQRKAISLRDGGCIIPGCHVPAAWCVFRYATSSLLNNRHHVTEHAAGGPTHTDNGVLLCWHHHRTLDSSGWKVRMRGGVPEVRGPCWWDASQRWRAVTTSPTRLSSQLRSRLSSG